METLPDPPTRFFVPAELAPLAAGTLLWRIYFRGGKHRTAWNDLRHGGPTSARFDHHTRPKRRQLRGILYATTGHDAVLTALAEVFQATRLVDRSRAEPWLVAFELSRSVELLEEGIAYRSSIVNLPAVAFYERARSALPPHPSFHQPLTHPGLAAGLLQYARRLGYGLR